MVIFLLHMGQGYDVVQMPAGMDRSDLPEAIEADVPFVVKSVKYVLTLDQHNALSVCEELDDGTTTPDVCKRYYIIKRMCV